MISFAAFFDTLSVTQRLQENFESVSEAEVHLFSYLSCLLSLYNRRPVSEWGYFFAGTKAGTPFSPEIHESIDTALRMGSLRRSDQGHFMISDEGQEQIQQLSSLSMSKDRNQYHGAACYSVNMLPPGIIREALYNEPELKRAIILSSTRRLLDGPGLELLYDNFAALSGELGVDIGDLSIPSIVWLTYLAQSSLESTGTEDNFIEN